MLIWSEKPTPSRFFNPTGKAGIAWDIRLSLNRQPDNERSS
jgi:hypothetical protein